MTPTVDELLVEADRLPPHAQVPILEHAQEVADQLGDEAAGAQVRFRLVWAYLRSADTARIFVPFGWLLQRFDAAPPWWSDQDTHQLLWRYKWMSTGLLRHPEVPLARIEESLAGMRERYRRQGEGMAPVLAHEFWLQVHLHGHRAAEGAFEAWRREPRTALSNCQACETFEFVSHLGALGRDSEALALAQPVLSKQQTCSTQPAGLIARVLGIYLRQGQEHEAVRLHLEGVRLSRAEPTGAAEIRRHVDVLVQTGALARALDLFTERLGEVDSPTNPESGMALAASGANLMRALAEDGRGDLEVRWRENPEGESVADLADRLAERAREIAVQFDARNGTPTQANLVERVIAGGEPLPAMPLGATARALPQVRTAADPGISLPPAFADFAARLEALGAGAGPELTTPEGAREAAALVEDGLRYGAHEDPHGLRDFYLQRRELVLAAAERGELAGAERAVADLEYYLVWAAPAELGEVELDAALSASARYRELGEEGLALLVEQRVAVVQGDFDRVHAMARQIDLVGTPDERVRSLLRVSMDVDLDHDRRAELARQGRMILGPLTARSSASERRSAAQLAALDLTGDPTALAADLDAAIGLFPDDDCADVLHVLLMVRSDLWRIEGEAEQAEATLARAEKVALQHPHSPALADVLLARSNAVLGSDVESGEALAAEAVRWADQTGVALVAVRARRQLAWIMASAGRTLEAAEVAEIALADVERLSDQPRLNAEVAETAHLTARILAGIGETDRAVALRRRAVECAREVPGQAQVAYLLTELAAARSGPDALEAVSLYREALAMAREQGNRRLVLATLRDLVWPTYAADGIDAALIALDAAVDEGAQVESLTLTDEVVAEQLDGWHFGFERLRLGETRARMLAEDGQSESALEVLGVGSSSVAEQLRALDLEGNALSVELLTGQAMLNVDRGEEAFALLQEVAQGARRLGASELQRGAVDAATWWLDREGRGEEADELWVRLSPDQ